MNNDFGIKVYRKKSNLKSHPLIFTIYIMGYIVGVKKGINRYSKYYNTRGDKVNLTLVLFHTLSSLLEDLHCIEMYLSKINVPVNSYSWKHYRNYIRHDIRDNLELYDDNRKKERSKIFHTNNSDLEFLLIFKKNNIVFGDTKIVLKLKDIKNYIKKVECIMNKNINDAKNFGLLKN